MNNYWKNPTTDDIPKCPQYSKTSDKKELAFWPPGCFSWTIRLRELWISWDVTELAWLREHSSCLKPSCPHMKPNCQCRLFTALSLTCHSHIPNNVRIVLLQTIWIINPRNKFPIPSLGSFSVEKSSILIAFFKPRVPPSLLPKQLFLFHQLCNLKLSLLNLQKNIPSIWHRLISSSSLFILISLLCPPPVAFNPLLQPFVQSLTDETSCYDRSLRYLFIPI